MCGPTKIASKTTANTRTESGLFLFSLESYNGDGGLPNNKSQFFTVTGLVLLLVAIELSMRQLFNFIKDMHPILEDEISRNILARHIGVDSFGCFIVAFLGLKARYVLKDVIDATIGGKPNAMPASYEGRMFTYLPEGQRVCLFFLAYQLKNTYDSIVWNDGMIFLIHHVLTLFTIWGGIQGNAHFYALYFFGISEISTGVLCLLANFDDEFGVVGLADAFPLVKAALGGIFALMFVIFRVLGWSTMSYYFCRDVWNALKGSNSRLELPGHRIWFRFTLFSNAILSSLQIIWLAEIVRIGKEELKNMGLI